MTDKKGVVALQSYGYDDRDRLTSWTLGSTTQSYGYDSIGNLASKGGISQSYGANANGTGAGPHQARSVGGSAYSYDLNGNLLSGGGRTLTWTYENQPATVTSNSVLETYTYNADDARVKKVRSGVSSYYLAGSWEEDSAGKVRKYYTLAGQTVAMREITSTTNSIAYMQGDHLGSVSVITNNSGAVSSSQEFDPWGAVRTGGIAQPERNFTGQILDDTGLLFSNARYYDPGIGRFVSADTIVPGNASGGMDGIAVKPLTVDFHEGGFVGMVNSENRGGNENAAPFGPVNTQALNRYSYVQNNPLKWADPSGHIAYSAVTAVEAEFFWADLGQTLDNLDATDTKGIASLIADLAGLVTVVGDLIDDIISVLENDHGEQQGIDFLAKLANGMAEELDRFNDEVTRTGDTDAFIMFTIEPIWNQQHQEEYWLNSTWINIERPGGKPWPGVKLGGIPWKHNQSDKPWHDLLADFQMSGSGGCSGSAPKKKC